MNLSNSQLKKQQANSSKIENPKQQQEQTENGDL